MFAAQRFHITKGQTVETIYGVVTSGKVWHFFQLTSIKLAYYKESEFGIVG
jgi:hypothetical protein